MTREERQLREAIIAKCRWMTTGLAEGAKVSYELLTRRSGKVSAEKLRTAKADPIGRAPATGVDSDVVGHEPAYGAIHGIVIPPLGD